MKIRKLNLRNLPLVFKELHIDIKPVPERLNIKINIEIVKKENIKSYCKKNNDMDALDKMLTHELTQEPCREVVVISQQNKEKLEKKYFDRLLLDLGYNLGVLFSKDLNEDYEAAINIGGYSIPEWKRLVNWLRKYNSNLAAFFGKRFAPGRSRLHIRIYEGRWHWYVIAHIDTFNWTSFDFAGIFKSHSRSGQGDYKRGTKYFIESLQFYFEDNQITIK